MEHVKHQKDTQYTADIPTQTISYAEKVKDDYAWAKLTIDAYIRRSYFSTTQHKWHLKKLYDLYNGSVDPEDYKLIIEPFGKRLEGDMADVINYPIIKPKIDLLRGEFAKRPKQREVYVSNADTVNKMLEEKKKLTYQTLEQMFINQLNQQGVPTGIPSEEAPNPEEQVKAFENSYRDDRAILGQNALEYIDGYNKLDEAFNLEWFHGLVSGEVYSFKTVEHNEPIYDVVNPLDIDYDKDPDTIFIEDGEWVVRRKYMNPSSIVEFFYDELGKTEEDKKNMINKIEQLGVNSTVMYATAPILYDRTGPQNAYNRLVEVKHVVWKSKKKIGICSFVDEFGQPQEMEVDETFKPLKELGQTVEWFWVNEVWEGYMIGLDIYMKIRPVPMQRASLDNLSKCKLPYNGRSFSNVNTTNVSFAMLGYPYQVLYNSTFHRLKLAMAKMKDDMIMLDINLKPQNMTVEEWLLYGDATNIMFVDYTKDGYRGSSTHQNVLKMASTTIQSYIELLRFIKQEWEEVCGISRQREGQIATSETVGGVERAVVQSSLITEIYFTLFDQFKEREYQGLIDYSKLAWINGKKTSFVQPDTGKIIYLDVDPAKYCEAEYGIFVALSGKMVEKRKQLESQLQNMIQNGAKSSSIIEIIESDNFAEIKSKMLKAEQAQDEYAQQMEQMKGEQQKELLAMQDELAAKQHERELEKIDRKGEWDLRKSELTAYGMDDGGDADRISEAAEIGLKQQELGLKSRELDIKETDSQRKAATDRYKADKQVEVAKMRPKPTTKK
jgi:hypothetical protein